MALLNVKAFYSIDVYVRMDTNVIYLSVLKVSAHTLVCINKLGPILSLLSHCLVDI